MAFPPQSFALRKGIACHTGIVDGYLKGVELQEGDVVVLVDLLPNRPSGYKVWGVVVMIYFSIAKLLISLHLYP